MDNLTRLSHCLGRLADGGLCVAFSGGVDSSLLLRAACELTRNVHAVTLVTPFHSPAELEQAERTAAAYGAAHSVITMDEMPPEVMANPPERCYLCKKAIFTAVLAVAGRHGLAWVLDGTNADDLMEYRPGLRALRELGVRSPLAELGFSKDEVRRMAASLGLDIADKPSSPCFATRFPYGIPIDPGLLPGVEALEAAIRRLGPRVVRARVHGDTIRLEVMPQDFPAVLEHRGELLKTARSAGFDRLTLDLAGYRSGSFDAPYRT